MTEGGEIRGRHVGAEVWKNTHGGLGSIYENEDDLAAELLPEQAETVNRGQVRNLNITSDAQRDPDQLCTYKFAEKTVDWDTHAGNNLPVLDGAMEPSKLEHMKLGTTIMPYGESLVNTQRIHEDDGAPKREETMLFDRHRARLGSPQHRLQGPRLEKRSLRKLIVLLPNVATLLAQIVTEHDLCETTTPTTTATTTTPTTTTPTTTATTTTPHDIANLHPDIQ